MIRAQFMRQTGSLCGLSLSGHAGYADKGEDIVCAAVTSAVQLTANGITEVLGLSVPVTVAENSLAFSIPPDSHTAVLFMEALLLHLNVLADMYTDCIEIIITEV